MRHKNDIILSRPDTTYEQFVVMIGNEHTWLIRLCARLTGNREIAEDLAQETSLEAGVTFINLILKKPRSIQTTGASG